LPANGDGVGVPIRADFELEHKNLYHDYGDQSSPYNFKGYFENVDGSGVQYYDENMDSTTTWNRESGGVIYAKWEKQTYSVNFVVNNGTDSSNAESFTVTATLGDPLPDVPGLLAPTSTDTKLTFSGYTHTVHLNTTGNFSDNHRYYFAAGEGLPLKPGDKPWDKGGDGTMYAYYGVAGYETVVQVDPNGGTKIGRGTITMQSDGTPSFSDQSFTRTGYRRFFQHAYLGFDANERIDGSGMRVSDADWDWTIKNLVAYAQWVPESYTVTFNTQGGTGGTNRTSATYHSRMPNANAPSKTGSKFAGYFETVNGQDRQYYTHDMASARRWDIASDTELHAHWIADSDIIVSFKHDPDGNVIQTLSGASGSSLTAPIDPSREGYNFTGWSPAIPGTLPATDTVYEAQWTANTYTVTLNLRGGTGGPTTLTATMGATLPVGSLTEPTRIGYTFNGFRKFRDGSGLTYIDESMTATNQVWDQGKATEIYADWILKTTTITLTAESADSNGTQTVTASYGKPMPNKGGSGVLKVPTRSNYIFGGYYAQRDGQGIQYLDKYLFNTNTGWIDESSEAEIYAYWISE
ncbi:MAG: InlB B-repeat-containing protein, partial [Candidatus Thiodiazotropha sp.]|nr:InlB B-repeat-containing protein [Candidatus Thiodiazotropha sp.]